MVQLQTSDEGGTPLVGIAASVESAEGEPRELVLDEVTRGQLSDDAGVLVNGRDDRPFPFVEDVDDWLSGVQERPGEPIVENANDEAVEFVQPPWIVGVRPFQHSHRPVGMFLGETGNSEANASSVGALPLNQDANSLHQLVFYQKSFRLCC